MKTGIKASKLRVDVLKKYRRNWENIPDKNSFFKTEDIWNSILSNLSNRIDNEYLNSVFNSLIDDKYIEVIQDQNNKHISGSRITKNGLKFLEEYEANTLTKKIALLGAITGCISLIISIISLIFI
jgi:hypothetical protein